jgi:hypothetical protein
MSCTKLRRPLPHQLSFILVLAAGAYACESGDQAPSTAVAFATVTGEVMTIGRLQSCQEWQFGGDSKRTAKFEGGTIHVWRFAEVGLRAAAVPEGASKAQMVGGSAADSLDRLATTLGCPPGT